MAGRWRSLYALLRWRTLGATRRLARESVGTLQGRLMVAMSVFALPGLVGLITRGGPLGAEDLDEAATLGALLLGNLGLQLCVFAMVPVLAVRRLVFDRESDPGFVHGGYHPEVAVFQAASAVLGTSAFLALFFTLVHGSLFQREGWGLVGSRFALFAAVTAHLIPLGTIAADTTRRFLVQTATLRRAAAIRMLGAVLFPALFPAFVWIPLAVHGLSVESLESVGRGLAGWLGILGPGVALLLAAGLLGSGWFLTRWLNLGPTALSGRERGSDHAGNARALPFAPRADGARSVLALFLWKDLFVERVRRPHAYFGLHTLLLAVTCILSTELASAPTVLAASAGLNAVSLSGLGKDGPAVALIRPAVQPARFFAAKWAVAWAEASAHVPLHALAIVSLAAIGPATALPALSLVVVGVLAGLAFSLLGTALGFVLPDPRRRSFFFPGASRAGQALYLSVVSFLVVRLS